MVRNRSLGDQASLLDHHKQANEVEERSEKLLVDEAQRITYLVSFRI